MAEPSAVRSQIPASGGTLAPLPRPEGDGVIPSRQGVPWGPGEGASGAAASMGLPLSHPAPQRENGVVHQARRRAMIPAIVETHLRAHHVGYEHHRHATAATTEIYTLSLHDALPI